MDAFCNGELLHTIFLPQCFLAVGRNRVVDLGMDVVCCQVTLQFIPSGRKDGKDMEDVSPVDVTGMDGTSQVQVFPMNVFFI